MNLTDYISFEIMNHDKTSPTIANLMAGVVDSDFLPNGNVGLLTESGTLYQIEVTEEVEAKP